MGENENKSVFAVAIQSEAIVQALFDLYKLNYDEICIYGSENKDVEVSSLVVTTLQRALNLAIGVSENKFGIKEEGLRKVVARQIMQQHAKPIGDFEIDLTN